MGAPILRGVATLARKHGSATYAGFPTGGAGGLSDSSCWWARSAVHAELSAELFNTANRANFNNPNVTQSGSGFGSITSATDPRIGQLALKLLF
jgi:hypothetical protein